MTDATTHRPRRRPTQNRRDSGSAPRAARPPRQPSALEVALTASQEDAAPTAADFAELGLPRTLVSGLARAGITAPTPLQSRAIPDALGGRDVVGRAGTGSGKTLAFGLPLLARLAGATSAPGRPRGLVVVPTRELAQQVNDALAPLAAALNLRVAAVYGGASIQAQVMKLRRACDVVIATPGRLEDHQRRGTCQLDDVQVAVLDEADHMADLGFLPSVTRILDSVPATAQRLLFSATMDRAAAALVEGHLTEPALHAVTGAVATVDTMELRSFGVRKETKNAVAAAVAARPGRTLLFVRTKIGAQRLADHLDRCGIPSEAIHGDRTQGQRRKALENFASGRRRVLVATDVAARGIHVDDVDLVVHYDPPNDHKDYLHRSGRTARAGRSGTVLSLVQPGEMRDHDRMLRTLGRTGHAIVPVDPEHPEVVELGTSGEPVVVVEEEPRRPRRQGPPRRGGESGAWSPRREGPGRPARSGSRPAPAGRDAREGRAHGGPYRAQGPAQPAQGR
ncbi:MAG: DEAD/DEAH box helicase [Kineosporiaceae bacterium]